MNRSELIALALTAALMSVAGATTIEAKPFNYKIPDEDATYKPGKNLDVVQNNCSACHSADYVKTQPHGPKFKKDFWQAEVTKMIKAYGAPIDDTDTGKIVDYLTENY